MSQTPASIENALRDIAEELRLLREQQRSHFEEQRAAFEQSNELDDQRHLEKLKANSEDLNRYMEKFGELLQQQDDARKAMAEEIDALRAALRDVLDKDQLS